MKTKIKRIISFISSLLMVIALFPVTDALAYTFTLGDYYYLQSALDSNMVVDVSGGSTRNGANIQLYKKNGSDAQLFRIARNGSGYYTLINRGSNKAIDVSSASTASGANIQQWTQNTTQAQQWKLYNASGYPDGYIRIMNKCGKYLDVSGGVAQNCTNIQLWEGNNTKAQVFRLVPYVQTTYKTYTLGSFTTVDEWKTRMQAAERSAMGISSGYYDMNGSYRNNTPMITGITVLAYKTIKVTYYQYGTKVTKSIRLPSKVKIKLHQHDYQKLVWFDFTNLSLTETCSCGARYNYTWEVPYP